MDNLDFSVSIEVPLETDVRDLVDAHLATQDIIRKCGGCIIDRTETGRKRFFIVRLSSIDFSAFSRSLSRSLKPLGFQLDYNFVPSLVLTAYRPAATP